MDTIYSISINNDTTQWISFQKWAMKQNPALLISNSKWDQHKNALILNKMLKKFKGCLIFSDKINYNSYVVIGIKFRSAEDLLHFKLKFH